jgi:secreted PhoX family phosphatase
MAKDFDSMEDSNRSANPSVHAVSDPARRVWLQGGLGAALSAALAPMAATLSGCAAAPASLPATTAAPGAAGAASGASSAGGAKLGFKAVAVSTADAIQVPEGYIAEVIAAWGEPVGIAGAMPPFRPDASNSAADQALQLGMHHDGIHFFPLEDADGQGAGQRDGRSRRGLLVMNHEYVDDGLLHPGGLADWSAEKVRKSQAAHGVSVVEVALQGDRWQLVRPSRHARRFTASTPFAIGGPAAGHPLMCTAADPAGRTVRGTINNCASGMTPWGTYLSGEENWAGYFNGPDQPDADQQRWGLRKDRWYRWSGHDERFDATKHPNEFHRFGWVVEIDPMDPTSTPVKRTALGRAAHEGAWVATTRDGRAVVYSGEDARFEYLYKFVSRDRIAPAGNGLSAAQANRTLLDHGTLYVARFDADGSGRWLPLVHGQGPLTAANGFADPGAVVIKARQASDRLGATKMDRPEWLAIDPRTREVFCTLTNNSARGKPGQPGVDAANPRADNVMGQIIRWVDGDDRDGDFDSTTMRWNHLLLAGDPANARPEARGNVQGDAFACPDGLAFDGRGVLWIQTDMSSSAMGLGELARLGNNQMLACDTTTGEVRRFLTGPVGCEVTGSTFTPDGRTLFINIQHPGESPSERSDPAAPTRFSTWPDGAGAGRPRSATVVIRQHDGGVIGA